MNRFLVVSDFVKPICLPTKGELYSGENLTAAGWGQTENDTNTLGSDVLLKVDVSFELSNSFCIAYLSIDVNS